MNPSYPFDPAPDWLIALLPKKTDRKAQSSEPVTELDTERAIERATDYLAHRAPVAIAFSGGNDTTYKVAARVRDFGVSEGVALGLMLDRWNPKCQPPWDPEELESIASNAFAYATAPWGGMSGLSEFEAVEIEERPKERHKIYWLQSGECATGALTQTGKPLIEGIFDQGALSMIYGASNSGKTFLMLDIAFHIAAGLAWRGRETARGLVAYIAAEGGRGILKRVAALCQKHKIENPPLAIIPCPVNLLNSPADLKAIVAAVKEAATFYGVEVKLIVVDTLSRALAGGDEHGPKDMGAFIKNLDKLRHDTGAALSIVHHTGKDEAKGARGWSGITAAIDTEIEISKNVIRITKQRDLEPAKDMRFGLERVVIGKDHKGRSVDTCVVTEIADNDFRITLSPQERKMLDVLIECAKAQAAAKGVPEEWQLEQTKTGHWVQKTMSASGIGERQLRRVRTSLAMTGHVEEVEPNQWVVVCPATE